MTGEQADRLLSAESAFWAQVEVVGRRTHYGKVTVETLGGAALLRVDTPPIPEGTVRERGYFTPSTQADGEAAVCQYGVYDVTYPTTPGSTHLIGIGSIYEITPMAEATVIALVARQRNGTQPIKVVRVADAKLIEAAEENDEDDEDDPYEEEGWHT